MFVLNVTIIIFVSLIGYNLKSNLLNWTAVYALTCVVFLLAVHVSGFTKTSEWPWFWIECVNSIILTVLFATTSTIVISDLSKGFIVTGVVGYAITIVYALDTLDKYNLAKTPRSRYVWTTPNMPELS
ncbi:uncharacterized protein LOC132696633 isoform X2 [Cylas formicarius]|uniref:uncharacterized protein LOC132696633 isoform X2 n=1 Tax=Cylas formicarius TaxID=197179 RepID=UPI002958B90D|nr:uncharacterized protein LOC132696633 isoform X2 [Cylas formicarius]